MLLAHARNCPLRFQALQCCTLYVTTTIPRRQPCHVRQHQRKAEHIPHTDSENETHYVLTLHTDAAHHASMTSLRQRFFPPKLNKLSAHIALFRALPGSQMHTILSDLTSLVSTTSPFTVYAERIFRLRQGVAVNVTDEGQSRAMHEDLQKRWARFLSKQDRSEYRPHYTVANKLGSEEAVQECLDGMRRDFSASEATVEGLALYRYDRGWWLDERIFWFRNETSQSSQK